MTAISLIDTSIASDNLGDQIIMDAVASEIFAAIPNVTISHTMASHQFPRPRDYLAQRRADFSVIGGTNALKSHMFVRGNWKITPIDILLLQNVVLLGVGWQQYQGKVDALSKMFFRGALSKRHLHSVRDTHSLELLSSCIPNVVNTSCPTLWQLDAAACDRISTRIAKKVIFSLTYYSPHAADIQIFNELMRRYAEVYFWPQQPSDSDYAKAIGMVGFTPIEPSIAAYNRILDNEEVDFVGTRLHGGIRALQRGRRTLVLAVDNRAREIAKDTNLAVVERESLASIKDWIERSDRVSISLPIEQIRAWKSQFSAAAH